MHRRNPERSKMYIGTFAVSTLMIWRALFQNTSALVSGIFFRAMIKLLE
jgi:hypothetical protein